MRGRGVLVYCSGQLSISDIISCLHDSCLSMMMMMLVMMMDSKSCPMRSSSRCGVGIQPADNLSESLGGAGAGFQHGDWLGGRCDDVIHSEQWPHLQQGHGTRQIPGGHEKPHCLNSIAIRMQYERAYIWYLNTDTSSIKLLVLKCSGWRWMCCGCVHLWVSSGVIGGGGDSPFVEDHQDRSGA